MDSQDRRGLAFDLDDSCTGTATFSHTGVVIAKTAKDGKKVDAPWRGSPTTDPIGKAQPVEGDAITTTEFSVELFLFCSLHQ